MDSLALQLLSDQGHDSSYLRELLSSSEDIDKLEATILKQLSYLKQHIVTLQATSDKETYEQLSDRYAIELKQLAVVHGERKKARDEQRIQAHSQLQGLELEALLARLQRESQQDSLEKRRLKQERNRAIDRSTQKLAQVEQQRNDLKQQYRKLSKAWQSLMQRLYFESIADKEQHPLPILYQDDCLIAIDKPAGLLSVPGRRYNLQDSAVARIKYQFPACPFLQPVHRLDRDTSGIFAIALSPQVHAALNQQFAQRQVHKTYEAILSKPIAASGGTLSLPLWGDPAHRPKQTVDFQKGKFSQTTFKRLTSDVQPRVQLVPHTGRTHQLRVQAAHAQGLDSPILGDTLYGDSTVEKRLHLHAAQLVFTHPITAKQITIDSAVPF